jgi:hypothetical protein
MPFPDTWRSLQAELAPGQAVDNWSANRGDLGDSFRVVSVTPRAVKVDTPGAQTIQSISMAEFEKVYDLWPSYRAGSTRRHEIRDATRFSKYIVSILRWLEARLGELP